MTRTKFLLTLAALAAAIFVIMLVASALLMNTPSGEISTPTAIAAQPTASLDATLVPTVTPIPASATPTASLTFTPSATPAPPSETPSPTATESPDESATPLPMLVLPAATQPVEAEATDLPGQTSPAPSGTPSSVPSATSSLTPRLEITETLTLTPMEATATPAETALSLLASPATRSWIVTATPGPPPTSPPLPSPGAVLPSPTAGSPTAQPASETPAVPSDTPEPATPQPTIAIIVPPGCEPPEGWVPYRVEEGDTLFGFQLGSGGGVDVATIRAENCLRDDLLSIGQIIFLPPGASDNAPKVDVSGGGGPAAPALPAGTTRTANCPCTITIGAGWRLEQIAAAVDAAPVGFTGADFLAATAAGAPLPDHWFLASKPAGVSLEGYMLPGTYTLDNSTDAVAFRDMVLNAFAANVGRDLEAGAAAQGLSFWQAVNMASIVQRESRDPGDQPLVASVFYNRLRSERGLGATVTIQYVLGRPGDWWPQLRTGDANLDSRYNGNRYKGLPPTPISNPGLNALRAVAFPAQTDYLYFSTRCDGLGHFYASTFEQFEAGLNCGS